MQFSAKPILIFAILHLIDKAISVIVEMESMRTEFNVGLIKNLTFDLITVNKRKVFNGSIIPAIDIQYATLETKLNVRQKFGRNYEIFAGTFDGCEYLSNNIGKSLSLLNLILRDVRNILKNLPSKCPWKKDTEVTVTNFFVDSEKWPVYVPEIKFLFTILLKQNETKAFELFINGVARQKRGRSG